MIQLLERLGGRSARGRLGALLGLALLGGTLLGAPASTLATPTDTAATHAFLRAQYQLYLALMRNNSAARASTAALSDRLGHECHGVLAGAPEDEPALGSKHTPPTPRQRGERQRTARQDFAIEVELGAALGAASAQPDRPAIEAYAAVVGSLSWSDTRIAPLVHANVAALQESAPTVPPDACTDMKAWADSGYRRLTPSSQTFLSRLATNLERQGQGGRRLPPTATARARPPRDTGRGTPARAGAGPRDHARGLDVHGPA